MSGSPLASPRRRLTPIVTIVLIAAAAVVIGGCSMGYAGDAPIAYMPASTDVTITPSQAGNNVLDIYSESGIGEAMFWVIDPSHVSDVTLRLHLRGLEQLSVTFSDKEIRTSVASHGDHAVMQSLVGEDGSETPIEPGSPYWIEITPGETADGMPGYFDLLLPPAVSESNGMFRLNWIDFYR